MGTVFSVSRFSLQCRFHVHQKEIISVAIYIPVELPTNKAIFVAVNKMLLLVVGKIQSQYTWLTQETIEGCSTSFQLVSQLRRNALANELHYI